LEWVLRESGSGLANLPEGSEAGLQRLARREVVTAAIHLHRVEGNDDAANIAAVEAMPGLHDAVVIAFARREQGLIVASGNPLRLTDLRSVAERRARIALRPEGAGAQLLLMALLAKAGLVPAALAKVMPPCPTGPDVAQAVRAGRADCGIATRAVARSADLDFVSLTWERFDLVVRQRDYFGAAQQALFGFLRNASFAARARELQGFDVSEAGQVRLVK
jgi:molybdate-binding protein